MASVGGILLGAGIAVWGFAAMRNPMLFSLTRMTEGYYQRLVLDRSQRIGLRNLGVVVGFFGLYMGTGISSGMVGSKRVERVAEAFALLLGLSFVLAITSGLVMFSIQLLRGKSFNWWSAWRWFTRHDQCLSLDNSADGKGAPGVFDQRLCRVRNRDCYRVADRLEIHPVFHNAPQGD